MKIYKKYLLLILLTIFIASCGDDANNIISPPPSPTDTLGAIVGKITDVSGMGIKGVQASLEYNGNTYSGFSDTTGYYSIVRVPVGSHLVYTWKNGYARDTAIVTVTKGDTAHVDFQLHQTFWYRLNTNSNYLQAADAYQNLYINPSQVIFASTKPNWWIGYNLGGFIKTSNFGDNWQSAISNGSATEIFRIADNNLFIFTAMGQDGLGHYLGENKLYRSGDYGSSWQEQIDLNLKQIDGYKLIGMNNGTLFFSMHGWDGSSYFYYFYKSVNQGGSWTSYSPVSQYNIVGLNKTGTGKIYIADYGDSLYYSTNGDSWTKRMVSNNTIRSNIINSVSLPTGEMIAYGGISHYNVSYDDGETWTSLNTSLSYLPSQFKYNSNNEILGIVNNVSNNAYGVYKSTDKCQTWNLIDEGLPNLYKPVSLALFQDYGYLLLEDGYLYKTSRKTNETASDNMSTIKNSKRVNR